MSVHSQTKTLLGNLMAYGASEAAAKLSRLLVVVTVARNLELHEIGMAATALAAGDILKAFTENGVGQRIIAAKDDALDATCTTAHRIFWLWCLGLFTVQCAIAGAYLAFGGSYLLAGLIVVLGAEYLFMPGGLVNVALAMRAGKLKQTASIAGAQMVGANVMSAALVLVWPSALALILPRLLAAPIWLVAVRRLAPWTRRPDAGAAPLAPFISYGWAVLGVELVKALRLHADKMVVGMTLGADALGLYFMAFNAGLSLSNAFSVAFAAVLFPHLAQTDDRSQALRQGILLSMGLIAPVVIAQALLAPYYVPVLLGSDWQDISGIVSILCLVAIPSTLWTAAAGWLRANNRPDVEFAVTLALTIGVTANIVLLAPLGLTAIAIGYAALATLILVGASLPAVATAFGPALSPLPVKA